MDFFTESRIDRIIKTVVTNLIESSLKPFRVLNWLFIRSKRKTSLPSLLN